jgi:hypothetical protein
MAVGLMKAALRASTVRLCTALGLAAGILGPAAQAIATDVAYVESVSGSVVATSQGKQIALDVLDTMGVQTQLDLQGNSELRICHYRTHKLLTLRGPLRAVVSASGVTGENGTAINGPAETCAAPVVSTFQGGLVTRGSLVTRAPAATAIIVPLRPSIKVVNHGTQAIRQIVLWDGRHQTILMNFDGSAARPIFNKGESYFLAVERSDGSELILKLRASGVVKTGPLILVVP